MNPNVKSTIMIMIGISMLPNIPIAAAIMKSSGQKKKSPKPKTNFNALHASFNPIFTTLNNKIIRMIATNMYLSSFICLILAANSVVMI